MKKMDPLICAICGAEIIYGEARHGYYLARSGIDGVMCPTHGKELDEKIDRFAMDYVRKMVDTKTNNGE